MDKAQTDAKKKLNDCYFYYYSKCTKGETCQFRHEPLALGCEVTCYNWQQANCFDYQCKYRHMELKKNRKQIPCYWETQPTGCLKKHCPFQHKLGDRNEEKDQESLPPQVVGPPAPAPGQEQGLQIHNVPIVPNPAASAMAHPTFQRPSRRPVVMDPSKIVSVPPAVLAAHQNRRPTHDPLLVNLEEESDSESTPSLTPVKKRLLDDSKRVITIKSLEQIRLERIQEEAAAFYPCYQNIPDITIKANLESFSTNENRYKSVDRRLPERYVTMSLDEIHSEIHRGPKRQKTETNDFKVLTLDEIRAKKRRISDEPSGTKVNKTVKVIDDEALEACLKNIRQKITSKPRKRNHKMVDVNVPKKPKLIRNRLSQPKSDTDNKEDNLSFDISDDVLDTLSDEDFSESELLQENVPDVVASCVSNSFVRPSTSKFTSIKDFKSEDAEFLKTLEEFLNE